MKGRGSYERQMSKAIKHIYNGCSFSRSKHGLLVDTIPTENPKITDKINPPCMSGFLF